MIQPAVFDLHAMLEETATLMRARAATRGVGIELNVAETVPRFVRSDRARLRQILLNLPENALAQWDSIEFKPIAEAIDNLFKVLGWLK